METDVDLQRRVIDELVGEPRLNAAGIGVCVEGGVITLTGHVETFPEKDKAGHIASKVHGVIAVANELEVGLPPNAARIDFDIARMAGAALGWGCEFPRNSVTVAVSDGWITLEGTVDHPYKKREAEDAVRFLSGVKGVINLITTSMSEAGTEAQEESQTPGSDESISAGEPAESFLEPAAREEKQEKALAYG